MNKLLLKSNEKSTVLTTENLGIQVIKDEDVESEKNTNSRKSSQN